MQVWLQHCSPSPQQVTPPQPSSQVVVPLGHSQPLAPQVSPSRQQIPTGGQNVCPVSQHTTSIEIQVSPQHCSSAAQQPSPQGGPSGQHCPPARLNWPVGQQSS